MSFVVYLNFVPIIKTYSLASCSPHTSTFYPLYPSIPYNVSCSPLATTYPTPFTTTLFLHKINMQFSTKSAICVVLVALTAAPLMPSYDSAAGDIAFANAAPTPIDAGAITNSLKTGAKATQDGAKGFFKSVSGGFKKFGETAKQDGLWSAIKGKSSQTTTWMKQNKGKTLAGTGVVLAGAYGIHKATETPSGYGNVPQNQLPVSGTAAAATSANTGVSSETLSADGTTVIQTNYMPASDATAQQQQTQASTSSATTAQQQDPTQVGDFVVGSAACQ